MYMCASPHTTSQAIEHMPQHCALPALGLCCLPPPPPCTGESIRQFTSGATYFEMRHQKWFTVEAVAVLQEVGWREATTAEL